MVSMSFEGFFEVFDVVISDGLACRGYRRPDERKIRSMVITTLGISRHGYHTDRSSMEISFRREYNCLILGNALLHVSPSSSKFDRSLNGFCTRVPNP